MVRWVRAVALSLLAVASTLAAHVSGGGAMPGLPMLLPVCALVTLSAAALLGRPLTWWWSGALLLAGQTALHGALQVLPPSAMTAGTGGPTTGGPALHAGLHTDSGPGAAALTALTGWSSDGRMVAAHVAVALLVGAWLAAGERALWTLVALAAGTLARTWLRLRGGRLASLTAVLVRPRRLVTPWAAAPAPVRIDGIRSGATRRGPPTWGCARPH
jgi:hypothetical protein